MKSIQNKIQFNIFTETTVGHEKLVRCHPLYRHRERWNEYVNLLYEESIDGGTEDDNSDYVRQLYPARLLLMFSRSNTTTEEEEIMGLFNQVNHQTVREIDAETQLFRHWILQNKRIANSTTYEPIIECFNIKTVQERIFCIETKPSKSLTVDNSNCFKILEAKSVKEEWPIAFINSQNCLK